MANSALTVYLSEENLDWLTQAAKRKNSTVNALLGEAVGRMRREEALDEVIAYLGSAAQVSAQELASIEAEWQG